MHWCWSMDDWLWWRSDNLDNLSFWLLLLLLILVLFPADAADNTTEDEQDNNSNDDTSWAIDSGCTVARSSSSGKHSWLSVFLEELIRTLTEKTVVPLLIGEVFDE